MKEIHFLQYFCDAVFPRSVIAGNAKYHFYFNGDDEFKWIVLLE